MIFSLLFAVSSYGAQPATFPVFLKQGFSTVLEFEAAPKRIVIGDPQNFQVERMEKSLVVRALSSYASGNLFVFFDSGEPRVFLLTASEDAEPTLYRKFEEVKSPPAAPARRQSWSSGDARGLVLRSARFDPKKDYLTVEASISADRSKPVRPQWERARLKYKSQAIAPAKLWAERKEVQKDAAVKARFVFVKPNIPRDFGGAVLVIPLEGEAKALSVDLRGAR